MEIKKIKNAILENTTKYTELWLLSFCVIAIIVLYTLIFLTISRSGNEVQKNQNEHIASDLGNIGLIYKDRGKPVVALVFLKDALALHKKIGDKQGIASDLGNIGLIYRDHGKPDEALKYLKESLEIFKSIGAIKQVEIASRAIEKIKQQSSD